MYFLGSALIPRTSESRSLDSRVRELYRESEEMRLPMLPDGRAVTR